MRATGTAGWLNSNSLPQSLIAYIGSAVYVCVRVAGTVHVRQPRWYLSAGSAESWPSQHHGGVNQWNPIRRHQRWERSWAARKAPTEAVRLSFHLCENTWVQVKPKVAYARLLCQVQFRTKLSCCSSYYMTYCHAIWWSNYTTDFSVVVFPVLYGRSLKYTLSQK